MIWCVPAAIVGMACAGVPAVMAGNGMPAVTAADDVPSDLPSPGASTRGENEASSEKPGRNGWIRLSKDDDVWIDQENKTVVVGGKICLREGMLEMFACPQHTKEHESIVSVNSKAFLVHAGLLAVGARVGRPVQWNPTYAPAKGTEVDVEVTWKDGQGREHRARAQDWVRHVGTSKPLEHPWVFVGSGFWTDPDSGRRYYHAEAGELICVSNFATAMMDLPVASSDANDALLFEAFTERIPPLGTPVTLLLRPKLEEVKKLEPSTENPGPRPDQETPTRQ